MSWARAQKLKDEHNLQISVPAICSRIQRGWSDEKIIANPTAQKSIPKDSHPMKRASFAAMAKRKGWDCKIR